MKDILLNSIGTVRYLSDEIGQRSYLDIPELNRTADFIEDKLSSFGYRVAREEFSYGEGTYYNIISDIKGKEENEDGMLLVGAHYDTVVGTPGADDNASGIAGLLELARLSAQSPPRRAMRFAAFCLEEPPAFMTSRMGSYVHARRCREKEDRIFGMISLEMLGYYSDYKGSQLYPSSIFRLFYPDRGNFIAFVGNISSKPFTKNMRDAFRAHSSLPVETLHGISLVPGVDFSDHRSFWKFGFPAFMITDTAFYRNPNYHGPGDTAETLDYEKMAELIRGLHKAISVC
jgi:Zn-dependent M28 family amino/carboxypeptidase